MIPDNDSIDAREIQGRVPGLHARTELPAPALRGALLRASQVEADMPASPMGVILAWVRQFLARPHPEVGRAGPVCPFTPTALALDSIWLAEVVDRDPDHDAIVELIGSYREAFLELDPRSGPTSLNKAILVVFPNLGADAAQMIDQVQAAQKSRFVDSGLMLGEFHSANESPGLRNPDFRPLRSPVPMLAMRHMVETDLPFLRRPTDPPQVRALYLRSYLRRLGTSVRKIYFDQAVAALVEAELELASLAHVNVAGATA